MLPLAGTRWRPLIMQILQQVKTGVGPYAVTSSHSIRTSISRIMKSEGWLVRFTSSSASTQTPANIQAT